MGDVIPLRPAGCPPRGQTPAVPGAVLSLRDRLYKRILEEAWAERLEREHVENTAFSTPRLRLVRP
jgi:hypothetical protein